MNDKELDDMTQQVISEALACGALRIDSYTEFGDPVYYADVDKMKDFMPEFVEVHLNSIENALTMLEINGMVEKVADDQYRLTEFGLQHYETLSEAVATVIAIEEEL